MKRDIVPVRGIARVAGLCRRRGRVQRQVIIDPSGLRGTSAARIPSGRRSRSTGRHVVAVPLGDASSRPPRACGPPLLVEPGASRAPPPARPKRRAVRPAHAPSPLHAHGGDAVLSRRRKQQREEQSARGRGRRSLLRLRRLLRRRLRVAVVAKPPVAQLVDIAVLSARELREGQEGAVSAGNSRAAARSGQAPRRAHGGQGDAELGLRRAPVGEVLGQERGVGKGRGRGLRQALLGVIRATRVAVVRREVEGGVVLRYDELAEILLVLRAVRPVLRVVEPWPGARRLADAPATAARAASPPPPRQRIASTPKRMQRTR